MLSVVLLIVVMLILSAFFSGMEIAFTNKNRLKLEIDRKQSRLFDRIAEVFSTHPGQYITTILVGNNIALVVYSLAMSQLLRMVYGACGWEHLAQNGSVAADTAISTVIIIFFAEFLPKSVFKNKPASLNVRSTITVLPAGTACFTLGNTTTELVSLSITAPSPVTVTTPV